MTGGGGRRAAKRLETHERLFDEAMRLFRERGFENVPVADIAKAAGVSVPTFYAHFESKDHVVLVLPSPEDVARLVGDLPTDLPTADLVHGVLARALADGGGMEAPDRVLERWRIIAASPALRLRAAAFERATADMVVAALPGEQAASSAARVTVVALLSAYTEVLLRWAASDGRRPAVEILDEVVGELRNFST